MLILFASLFITLGFFLLSLIILKSTIFQTTLADREGEFVYDVRIQSVKDGYAI